MLMSPAYIIISMVKIKKLTLLTHQSILAINCDVIKDLGYATEHKHTHMNHIYHSQNKLSNQGPSQLCPSHRNVEKKENILIKAVFLRQLGGVHHILLCLAFVFTLWEHVMCLSWYLYSHYNMYLGAKRKVCVPVDQGKKKNPRPSWRRGETQRLQGKGNIWIVLRVLIYYKATQCN